MKLYHGSIEIVEAPVIFEKQRLLDFGKGFYTTTNRKQAERWAIIKQNREGFNTKIGLKQLFFQSAFEIQK